MRNLLSLKSTNSVFLLKMALLLSAIVLPYFAQGQNSDIIPAPKEFNPSGWNWGFILLAICTILGILIVARVFDISRIAEKITGKTIINWHKVNAWIALIFLILGAIGVWYEMKYHGKYVLLNDSSSEHGAILDSMFTWTFMFTFVVFIITETLLFYFAFRYRYREGEKALYYYHNNKLELIWTVVPAIVLTVLVLRGFNTWTKITGPDSTNGATEIEVLAKQFGWFARYSGEDGKLGESNFVFISSKNELGVAEIGLVDEHLNNLNKECKTLSNKLMPDSLKYYIANCKMDFEAFSKSFGERGNEKAYNELKEKYEDAVCGAYARELHRTLDRKKLTIERIEKYKNKAGYITKDANDDRITEEIVLIKNRKYNFKFRAKDVIHSAYAPEFRLQMNCVPGMPTNFAFKPTKTTTEARAVKGNKDFDFYMYCNKICGKSHARMKIKITVVTEAEYATWIAKQPKLVPDPVVSPKKDESKKDTTQNKVAVK